VFETAASGERTAATARNGADLAEAATTGPSTVNCRLTRSELGAASGSPTAASAPVKAPDAGLAHQPGDPLVVDHQSQPESQLGVNLRPPVGSARLGVDWVDLFGQQLVLLFSGRRRQRGPLVVSRAGHIQYRQATAMSIPSAASSWTNRNPTLGERSPARRTRPLVADLILELQCHFCFRSSASSFFSALVSRESLPRSAPLVDLGLVDPVPKTRVADAQFLGQLCDRCVAGASQLT